MRSRALLVAGYVLVALLGLANVQIAADCDPGCGAGSEVTWHSYFCNSEFDLCNVKHCSWGNLPCEGLQENFEYRRKCEGWADCGQIE